MQFATNFDRGLAGGKQSLRSPVVTRRLNSDEQPASSSNSTSASPYLNPVFAGGLTANDARVSESGTSDLIILDDYTVFPGADAGASTFQAVDSTRNEQCRCRIHPAQVSESLLEAHRRLASKDFVSRLRATKIKDGRLYAFYDTAHGDLHSMVREKSNLDERTAATFFKQLATALLEAHSAGIVLRDLRLRHIVFSDPSRTKLAIDNLADSVCLVDNESANDLVHNTQQTCPSYISPEMLASAKTNGTYPGRASDCWFLGVVLCTLLTGQYPFCEKDLTSLFQRIQSAFFSVPQNVSTSARSLIRALLRREPTERLTALQILDHPWLSSRFNSAHVNARSIAPRADPVNRLMMARSMQQHQHQRSNDSRTITDAAANASMNTNTNSNINTSVNADERRQNDADEAWAGTRSQIQVSNAMTTTTTTQPRTALSDCIDIPVSTQASSNSSAEASSADSDTSSRELASTSTSASSSASEPSQKRSRLDC